MGTETAILFAKPGAVRPSDKGALRKIGVVVVEIENLDDVRLVRPEMDAGAQLPASEMLRAYAIAVKADRYTGNTSEALAKALSDAIIAGASS